MLIIKNGTIITPQETLRNMVLVIGRDKIQDILPETKAPQNTEIIDAGGGYILPGFVDIHLHGGAGYDFMDAEHFSEIADIHAKHGTTAIVPTTVSCNETELFQLFHIYRQAAGKSRTAEFLGLHLEGPFISREMKGAQNENCIRYPDSRLIDKLLDEGGDIINRCTAAPELPGMEAAAKKLTAHGIKLAAGHSNATCEQMIQAYDMGFTHITHLYCSATGVRKIGQKVHAGMIQAAFLLDGMTVELIGDGKHIPRELMQMTVKLKGADKTILVTDAMRATGTGARESYLGAKHPDNRVIIEGGVAKLPDRSSFAGSIATADKMFQNAVINNGIPIEQVSRMMSLTPAKIAGAESRKGSLEQGKDADIVIMDQEMKIKTVFARGNRVE